MGMAEIQLIKGAANGNPSDSLPTMYDKVNKNTANINNQVVNHEVRLGTAESAVSDHGSRIAETEAGLVEQQAQMNTLVLNGDSSPAASQAAVDSTGYDYQNLKLRLDTEHEQLSTQLADIETNMTLYKHPDDVDDTEMFIRAHAVSKNLFLPQGDYYYSGPQFLMQSGTIMRGIAGKTRVHFTTPNADFILANEAVNTNTGFSGCILKDIDFWGLGKDHNQSAGNLLGFLSEIDNCRFYDFKRGLKFAGVRFIIRKPQFWNCDRGLVLQDNIDVASGSPTFSTLIHVYDPLFYYCDLGFSNYGDGQTYLGGRENVIDLQVINPIFESNVKGFDLKPFYWKLINPWFEKNAVRSTCYKNNLTIETPRYETNTINQHIEYLNGDPAYTGIFEIGLGGLASIKTLKLQRYDSNAQDVTNREYKALKVSSTEVASAVDYDENTTRALMEANFVRNSQGFPSDSLSRMSQIIIKGTGEIQANGLDQSYAGTSVTKLATGRYKIVFRTNGAIFGAVNVGVYAPDSAANDTNDSNMYFGAMRLRNTINNADFVDYNAFNALYVDAYKKTPTGDVLADAKLHIILYHK